MSTIEAYREYFEPEAIPDALARLIGFATAQRGWFSEGFELECDSDDVAFRSCFTHPAFLNSLFAIGQADGTASIYALWRQSGMLSDAPIVVFGGEGGAHVVAKNLVELFRILTLDTEPMIDWDEVTYHKPRDAKPSEGAADFAEWLARNFNAKPVRDADKAMQIVNNAQAAHEKEFQAWLKRLAE